jgi:hypothetical protein
VSFPDTLCHFYSCYPWLDTKNPVLLWNGMTPTSSEMLIEEKLHEDRDFYLGVSST